MATERLVLAEDGHIRYALKTHYRDGTTHVIFEPMDFIARLVALAPKPRADRYTASSEKPEAHRHPAMTWAKRLKRVFAIEIDESAGQPICTDAGRREGVCGE